jgi:hypothetical protein
MGRSIPYIAGFASSAVGDFTLFDSSLPPEQRQWSSKSRRPSWVEGLFRSPLDEQYERRVGTYYVTRLVLALRG